MAPRLILFVMLNIWVSCCTRLNVLLSIYTTWKSSFTSFNSVFHRAGRLKDKLVTLHLVSFCRPYLLYATDCLGLSVTQMWSLRNTWQCAVSHIFNVSGQNVNFICDIVDDASLDMMIVKMRIKFLSSLKVFHSEHRVLRTLYSCTGRQELVWLRAVMDVWCVLIVFL